MSMVALTLLAGAMLSTAAPILKRGVNGPVITSDFPDPGIVKVDDTWYAFGTQSNYDYKNVHIQIASSTDFSSWNLHEGDDALPNLPSWVDSSNPLVWAPDILALDDGTFVLYFSATTNTAGDGKLHCVGTATSSSVTGPYIPSDQPWACPTDRGGAIDAAGFHDSDGTWYITYKIDGNAMGNGGICNNGVEPIVNTPILIQKVGSDGITKQGGATAIMNLQSSDGPDIEAPAMVKKDNTYVLMFSSHCYSTDQYDTLYATSNSPTGGFVRGGSVVGGGQGGLDASFDAEHVVFHGLQDGGRRFMYAGTLNIDGDKVSV